jgi:hypothetical protein
MFKLLGAIAFGILSVFGVTYLILKKQEDKAIANQIDCHVFNFLKTIQRGVTGFVGTVKDQIQTGPLPVEVPVS